MEPVIASAIINGILCGAASGVSTVATTELVEAYRKLRGLLQKKFGQDSILLRSIGNLEQRPESKTKQAGVVEDADELGADKDPELVQAAQVLLAVLKETQPQTTNHAEQSGSGAIAQNGSVAAGAGGVAVGGNVQGNVFTHNGSGEQNIAQGKNAIGKQVNNYNAQQALTEEMIKLLAEIRKQLPSLPEEAREDVQHELKKAQEQVEKNPPDTKKIAERLNNAAEVVEALPRTFTAVGTVIGLVKQALHIIGL